MSARRPRVPVCDTCNGTGWRIIDDGAGHTHAARCECYVERAHSAALDRAGVPPRYDHCTLDSFEIHHPSHKQARRVASRFVDQFPEVEGQGSPNSNFTRGENEVAWR